jgi:HAD superfamily hydrolase (TIGR01484 family)
MLELKQWPIESRSTIRGVFTDIDDTLTEHGQVSAATVAALAALKQAGLTVMAITGRPVGWCEPFAKTWPIDAIVAENGAVALYGDDKLYLQDAPTRQIHQKRMAEVTAHILAALPHARLAQDSAGRETDIAIDHSEFHRLGDADIARVVQIMRDQGMCATVSSIHVNGWFGTHNKWVGAQWVLQALLGRDLQAELSHWAYVGDSANDAVMFEHFQHSVGVANIALCAHQLHHLPRYITPSERGAGFVEVAQALLAARASRTA